jgi:hypothetical protein
MKLETIAEMLENASVGVAGSDIFINMIPAEVTTGILLRQYFTGTKIDHELPGMRKTSFFVIARSPDYLTAKGLAESAVAALHLRYETEVGTTHFKYMRPRTEPFVYAPSPGQLVEFSVVIDCCYSIG